MNNINDDYLNNQYNKYKFAILGSKTKDDAIYQLNSYNLDNKSYNLLMSLINNMDFKHALSYSSMKKYITDMAKIQYKEEAQELFSYVISLTSDIAQIRTFTRLFEQKKMNKQQDITTIKYIVPKRKNNIICKKCPHCFSKCFAPKSTTYIVCGFADNINGFDMVGCTRDWCFRCNKMLCKSWERDHLYLPTNRYHDAKCCKKHASINNNKYPEQYCFCLSNIFISRDVEE